jgi:hypothetical protein
MADERTSFRNLDASADAGSDAPVEQMFSAIPPKPIGRGGTSGGGFKDVTQLRYSWPSAAGGEIMRKIAAIVLAACAVATVGCGDDDNPTGPSANTPAVFTSQLSPANEVPAVTNAESTARGAVQITFDVTRNASNAITAATASFYVQVTGLPAGTNIVGAHIHPGAAGVNGPVIVNTGLSATAPLTMSSGATEFTARGIAVDPALAQSIMNNPAAFYFNVHTPLNPGGVARGQLTPMR